MVSLVCSSGVKEIVLKKILKESFGSTRENYITETSVDIAEGR